MSGIRLVVVITFYKSDAKNICLLYLLGADFGYLFATEDVDNVLGQQGTTGRKEG
jgi:hypothetical protein